MIKKNTPCNCEGLCPYDFLNGRTCEYWCGNESKKEELPDEYTYEELIDVE